MRIRGRYVRGRWIGCGVLFMGWAIFLGPMTFMLVRNEFPRQSNLAEVSGLLRIRFPASARLTHSAFIVGFPDGSLDAVIEIDARDTARFLHSIKSSETSRTERLGFEDGGRPSWLDVSSARRFVAVQADPSFSHGGLDLLFDLDNPNRTVIYLRWYGT